MYNISESCTKNNEFIYVLYLQYFMYKFAYLLILPQFVYAYLSICIFILYPAFLSSLFVFVAYQGDKYFSPESRIQLNAKRTV